MRYYSTQRPIVPGSFPKPAGNLVLEIYNFDERRFCSSIGREAWGYIIYSKPLPIQMVMDFELVPEPMGINEICAANAKQVYAVLGIREKPVPVILQGSRKVGEEKFILLDGEEYSLSCFIDGSILLFAKEDAE